MDVFGPRSFFSDRHRAAAEVKPFLNHVVEGEADFFVIPQRQWPDRGPARSGAMEVRTRGTC